ncbi:MAG: TetR/AcrR family transcriptional regulator [Propionibacterium sp.]
MGSKEKLMDAMTALLWERGYADTSPRDVMTLAGVGQGSMYHHFSGKHELAQEAIGRLAHEVVENSDVMAGDQPALQRIRDYLRVPRVGTRGCRVGRLTQDPQVVDDPELLAPVTQAFEIITGRWTAVLQEAVDTGELPAGMPVAAVARTMAAVIQGGYVLAKASGTQQPMDDAIEGAIALLDTASASVARGKPRASEQEKTPAPGDRVRTSDHSDKKESA